MMSIFQESAKLRADSLRSRITMLHNFCAAAESQLSLRALGKLSLSIQRIRRAQSEIEKHLQEPHYVPSGAATELWQMFEEIKPRIERLERALSPGQQSEA